MRSLFLFTVGSTARAPSLTPSLAILSAFETKCAKNSFSLHRRSLSQHHRPLTSLTSLAHDNLISSPQHRSIMPEPPHSYSQVSSRGVTIDLSQMVAKVEENEKQRQEAYDFSRKIQVALVKAQTATWAAASNHDQVFAELEALITSSSFLQSKSDTTEVDRVPRPANLSNKMQDFLSLKAFRHFLETSSLLPPPANVTDEEYLAGACMGLAQDLQQYGLGRATVRDTASVQAAADLVGDILNFLLELDFRNGALRRRYDGTKYSLRSLETLLYELSITSQETSKNKDSKSEPHAKKTKTESALLPNEALLGIKSRMEHRDQLRETLIKKCRDDQKAAKHAIFALHRNDLATASQLIEQCETSIQNDLLPIVQDEPPLRHGSFANVLEEYVEARLYATWLGDDPNHPTGKVMGFTDFPIALEPEDYVGGLCDLTGEVGRFAVNRGTVRDLDSVRLCLQTNQAVLSGLQMMEHTPQGTNKKMDAVRRSVEKLQRMLYEMSLSEAAGRSINASDVEMQETNDINES